MDTSQKIILRPRRPSQGSEEGEGSENNTLPIRMNSDQNGGSEKDKEKGDKDEHKDKKDKPAASVERVRTRITPFLSHT